MIKNCIMFYLCCWSAIQSIVLDFKLGGFIHEGRGEFKKRKIKNFSCLFLFTSNSNVTKNW
jgi:hypothetical protein